MTLFKNYFRRAVESKAVPPELVCVACGGGVPGETPLGLLLPDQSVRAVCGVCAETYVRAGYVTRDLIVTPAGTRDFRVVRALVATIQVTGCN